MAKQSTKISDLIADDKNFNKGSEFGNSLIEKSFRKFGAGRSILIDKNNRIIAGNKSVENAMAIGMEDVQIVESDGTKIIAVKRTDIDLDSPQGREMALADNASAKANIVFDAEVIEAELGEAVCVEWGIELAKEEPEAEEDDFEVPEGGIETDIVLGDLFEIGEHRLLCGDSTCSDTVAKLMNGEKADMVFTDPPYGVDYHSQNKTMYYGNGKKGKERERIIGDKTTNVYAGFLPLVNLFCNGVVYLFCGAGKEKDVLIEIENNNFELINTLIWDKQRFGGQAIGANYKPCFELFYYILPKGNKRNWIGANNEETIWRLKRDNKTDYHPTQKPIELSAKAINNHSGNVVLDFFLGSGSTMVASHQLKRKCYGMELDCKYCQVIIDRMQKLDPTLKIKRNGQPYEVTIKA
jgi:DNA modification methylase